MNIIGEFVVNFILIMFPILVYFIYNCYRELCMEKYNSLLLNFALVSSFYLCIKYGNMNNEFFSLLFCNLPIVMAYLKKQSKIGILLSLFSIFYVYLSFHYSIWFISLKYVIYYLLYYISIQKKVHYHTFVLSIVVIQGFCLGCDYFVLIKDHSLFGVMELLVMMLLFYIIPFIMLYLFDLGDKITRLYSTSLEFENDKEVRESFFKITHEVKNPIAVCKGYLDMLDINDEKKIQKYIPVIKNELNRSLDIMNDFMEFSKIKIDKDIIDINLLVEDVFEEFRIIMLSHHIKFDSFVMKDEVFINGDYNRLKQVLINLLKNSVEAIHKNGEIKIMTHILKNQYCIEIVDNGMGMDEDTLGKIKNMFFTTKDNGTGLGVSLSNEIIKAHDGSLNYFSKLGYGTKVIVKIPIMVI